MSSTAPVTPRSAVTGGSHSSPVRINMNLTRATAPSETFTITLILMSGRLIVATVHRETSLIELKSIINLDGSCSLALVDGDKRYTKPMDLPFKTTTSNSFNLVISEPTEEWDSVVSFQINSHSFVINKNDSLYDMQKVLLKPFRASCRRFQAAVIINGSRYEDFYMKPFNHHEKLNSIQIEVLPLTDLRIFTPACRQDDEDLRNLLL